MTIIIIYLTRVPHLIALESKSVINPDIALCYGRVIIDNLNNVRHTVHSVLRVEIYRNKQASLKRNPVVGVNQK